MKKIVRCILAIIFYPLIIMLVIPIIYIMDYVLDDEEESVIHKEMIEECWHLGWRWLTFRDIRS